MTAPSWMWWVGLLQFLACGLFSLAAIVLPKIHHFPSSDRPSLLGIAFAFGVLALIGLIIMAGA